MKTQLTLVEEWDFVYDETGPVAYPELRGGPKVLNFSTDEGSYIAKITYCFITNRLVCDVSTQANEKKQTSITFQPEPVNNLPFSRTLSLIWYKNEDKIRLYSSEIL